MFLDFLKFGCYSTNFSILPWKLKLFVMFECHALVSVLPVVTYFTSFVFLTKCKSMTSWGRSKFREIAVKGINSTQISNVKYRGKMDVYPWKLLKQWLKKPLHIVQAGEKTLQLCLCHLRGATLERHVSEAVPHIPSL